MRSILRYIVVATTWLILLPLAYSQAPNFSQYYATGLYLNPALAGIEAQPRFSIHYRNQWTEVEHSFKTAQASIIYPLIKKGVRPKHTGGIGVSAFTDEIGQSGAFKTTGFTVAAAYDIHLNEYGNNLIALGAQVGHFQRALRQQNVRWTSQYDPTIGYDPTQTPGVILSGYNSDYIALNAGIMWFYKNKYRYSVHNTSFFNGLAINNLNEPQDAFLENSAIPMLYKLHGGMHYNVNRKVAISPNYIIQLQGTEFQTNVGAYSSYTLFSRSRNRQTKVILGLWYRLMDSFIISAGIKTSNLEIGLSYDQNASALSRSDIIMDPAGS